MRSRTTGAAWPTTAPPEAHCSVALHSKMGQRHAGRGSTFGGHVEPIRPGDAVGQGESGITSELKTRQARLTTGMGQGALILASPRGLRSSGAHRNCGRFGGLFATAFAAVLLRPARARRSAPRTGYVRRWHSTRSSSGSRPCTCSPVWKSKFYGAFSSRRPPRHRRDACWMA